MTFTLFIVSFTGYVYSRFRFKVKKVGLMAIMLIQNIPAFAGIVINIRCLILFNLLFHFLKSYDAYLNLFNRWNSWNLSY